MSPNAKKDWNSWWKGREKDYENEIVLPVPSSDVYPAGIGGKEEYGCIRCKLTLRRLHICRRIRKKLQAWDTFPGYGTDGIRRCI